MFVHVLQNFAANGYSWSENYYLQRPNGETLETIIGQVWVNPLAKRMAFMNKDVTVGLTRISEVVLVQVPPNSGAGFVKNTGLVRPGQFLQSSMPPSTQKGALPNVAMKGRFFAAGQGRSKGFTLRGTWTDLDEASGSISSPSGLLVTYKALFDDFVTFLKGAGGGWFASTKNLRVGNIDNVVPVVAGGGRQLLTMGAAFFDATEEVGKHVQIRISSASRNPTLAGTVVVLPLTTTTAETVKPVLIDSYVGGAKATITPKSFITIDAGSLERIGHHDTKNPTLGSRGRQKAQSKG